MYVIDQSYGVVVKSVLNRAEDQGSKLRLSLESVIVQPGFESLLDTLTYALLLGHAPSRFRLARGVTDGRLYMCFSETFVSQERNVRSFPYCERFSVHPTTVP